MAHGGSFNDAFAAGLIGAGFGAISAAGAHAIGSLPVFSKEAMEGLKFSQLLQKELLRAGLHGSFQGGIRVAQGGKFIHGFASGAMGSLSGSLMGRIHQKIHKY